MKPIYSLFIMLSFAGQLRAQNDTTELFPYGDMNQWMVRVVDESLVIGGNTKYLYECRCCRYRREKHARGTH